MLISKEKFQSEYGRLYEEARREAEEYVAHPEKLKAEIESKKKERDPMQLRAPEADQFSYRMTLYQGFVRYPERLKNYIIARNEPRSAIRSFLPTIMDIEPNSRCIFRCIMCQVSEWGSDGRAEDMPFGDFKKFIESQTGLIEVKLHGMGEPLLHKEFFDMTMYLVERFIWTRTNTNGYLLHIDENYRRLIDSGIGEVQCSFDGATKEVYENIRISSNFEQVVQNFTCLNNYANGLDRPYTRMWVVIQKSNRHQIFEFVEMAKRMGFRRLTFSLSLGDWGQEKWREKKNELEAKGDFSMEERLLLTETAKRDGIDITIWKQADKYSTNSVETLCPWPFNRPYISCDLRIVPCCMIANPEIVDLGSAKDFEQVWNGNLYQAFRNAHLEGDIPQPCRTCYELSNV